MVAEKRKKKHRLSKREQTKIRLVMSIVMAATLFVAVALEVRFKVRAEGNAHVSFVIVWLLILLFAWAGLEIWILARKLVGGLRRPTPKGRRKT